MEVCRKWCLVSTQLGKARLSIRRAPLFQVGLIKVDIEQRAAAEVHTQRCTSTSPAAKNRQTIQSAVFQAADTLETVVSAMRTSVRTSAAHSVVGTKC